MFSPEKLKLHLMFSNPASLRIITGANFNHFKSLTQLLESIRKNESIPAVTVYDLGLNSRQVIQLEDSFENLEIKRFNYEAWPSYFNISCNAGEYAWKPVIIESELQSSDQLLLWLDAGCIVDKPLKSVRKILRRYGFYSPVSQGTIQDWTHPGMLQQLSVLDDLLHKRNLAGCVVGLNPKNIAVQEMVKNWADCAKRKECIAPEGSSRKNHRQDQAALSVLAWQKGLARLSPKELHGIKIHCDID